LVSWSVGWLIYWYDI